MGATEGAIEGEATSERRRALRVPVRAIAVVHTKQDGPLHGMLENLSQTGALVSISGPIPPGLLDVELRLVEGPGWVSAHTVRIQPAGSITHPKRRWQLAVAFDRVEPAMREAIEATIIAALSAARRRPILVIDDHAERRADLIAALAKRGMTPIAPRTPLEAIDLLTRTQLHVDVCLLARSFGIPSNDFVAVLGESFPWVTTAEISDDVESTADRAVLAWETTPVARLGTAIS
jgi:hypothetical protein